MSGIPPNWMASIIGGHDAARQADVARKKEEAQQAQSTGAARFAENLKDVINEQDRDSQVYADSEGLGGQGRDLSHEPEPAAPPDETPGDDGPPEPDPAGGLDIQA